jgi:hypothetical protein
MLVNNLDSEDKHPEFKVLGSVEVEGLELQPTLLSCSAERKSASRVLLKGKIEGIGGNKKFLVNTSALLEVVPDGNFSGYLTPSENGDSITEAICLLAGTAKLTSSSSGYVPIITTGGLRGDLNDNRISADAGDLVLMKQASIGEIIL